MRKETSAGAAARRAASCLQIRQVATSLEGLLAVPSPPLLPPYRTAQTAPGRRLEGDWKAGAGAGSSESSPTAAGQAGKDRRRIHPRRCLDNPGFRQSMCKYGWHRAGSARGMTSPRCATVIRRDHDVSTACQACWTGRLLNMGPAWTRFGLAKKEAKDGRRNLMPSAPGERAPGSAAVPSRPTS